MPYTIHPYRSGFRVYSESGTPLSKKALTWDQAHAQMRAVYAVYGRKERLTRRKLKGGNAGPSYSAKDKEEDDEIRSYPLSDGDILKILPDLIILSYPDFNKMNSIDEAFDSQGRCLFLYLTEDHSTGHWICMIRNGKEIEYFDPYGGYDPDEEGKWLSESKLKELGQHYPTLTMLLEKSGAKVIPNPYAFQKDRKDIATCGRHCVVRLYMKHLNLKEYKKWIEESGMTPDDFVSSFTYYILKK
jgi:hypothetical protein